MTDVGSGFETRLGGPTRRAIFDLKHQIAALEQRVDELDAFASGGIPRLLSAFWQFATATTPPPAAGNMRCNAGVTQLYIAKFDTDGFDRSNGLLIASGAASIYIRGANGGKMNLTITGTPTDSGTYWTYPVAIDSGVPQKGARNQINFLSAPFSP